MVVLDFDAEESIHETGNGTLMMGPVIRVAYIGVVGEDGSVEPSPDSEIPLDNEPEPDAGLPLDQ